MKTIWTALLVALATVMGADASAAQQDYVMSCEDIITQLNREATAEAKERFADLEGSCMGVVDRDGELFMHTRMIVRRIRGNTITMYLPATDRTFRVETSRNERVMLGNNRVRVSELSSGQQLNIFVPVEEFTQPIIEQVAFETEVEEEIVIAPVVLVVTLPTTG